MSRGRSLNVLMLFVLLSLVRSMLYAALVPPWQAPDEPKHFEYVKLLYQKRRMIGWSDISPSLEREIISSMDKYDYWRSGWFLKRGETFQEMWGNTSHKLEQPPLSYILYAIPLLLFTGKAIALQLYTMRCISIILSILITVVAFLTINELFPDDEFLLIGIVAFVVFLPMHTFMTSSVNSDHLAELFTSLLMLLLTMTLRKGATCFRIIAIALSVVLGLFAKRTAFVAIPTCIAAVPIYFWGKASHVQLNWRKLALVFGVVTVAIAIGMRFGDKLQGVLAQLFPKLLKVINHVYTYYLFLPSEQFPLKFDQGYFSYGALQMYCSCMESIFESFWGNFGWLKIRLDTRLYLLIGLASLVAFIGLCLFASRAVKIPDLLTKWQKGSLLLFSLSVFFDFIIIMAKQIRDWGYEWGGRPQGRFLFPVLIPIATLFMLGLRELIPARYQKQFLIVYIGCFIVFDSLCLIRYIIPFFYG